MLDITLNEKDNYINIGDEVISKENILKKYNVEIESQNFLSYIENQRVGDKYIFELYKYENVDMYNFCRAMIIKKLKNMFSKYFILKNIQNLYGDDIRITTDDIVISKLCNNVLNINNELINTSDENIETKKENPKYMNMLKRTAKSLEYYMKYKLKKSSKENMLLISQTECITESNLNNENIVYDCQYGKLYHELKRKYNIFNLQFLSKIDILHKSDKIDKEYFAFELFILYKKFRASKLYNKDKLEDNLDQLNNFNYEYNNTDFKNVMLDYVFGNIKDTLDSYIKEWIAARELIKDLNINKIILIDEADRFRCFILAGNKEGLDTYAIQHGLINETSSAYLIKSKQPELVPKKTFLWGEKFGNLLKEYVEVYGDDNIKIVGQLRTDYLSSNIVNEEENHNIKIFFAPQPIEKLRNESTEMLFKAIKKLDNYDLIIKLHPAEKDMEFYHHMAEKYNIKNYKVLREKDIYECIIWCDVVVTVHSTVALEAVMLKRKSICILLPEFYDEGNFVKDGISYGAENSQELVSLIKNIKQEEFSKDTLFKEYFYKVDGEVYKRILNNID